MLKEVFEKDFYLVHPKRESVIVNVVEHTYTGDFSLCDSKSCLGWSGREACASKASCNHENLHVHAAEEVYVVSMDQILGYLNEVLPHNADFVACGSSRFRVLEMTCMEEKYVNGTAGETYPGGKRAHAQSQCEKLVEMMYMCGPIRQFVEHHQVKESIFAWRNTDEPDIDHSMSYYARMQDVVDSSIISLPMQFDFRFRTIKYPSVLEW